jgi:hypothetical protein
MRDEAHPVLLAGGSRDPHLIHLHRRLAARGGGDVRFLAVGTGADPSLTWDLRSDALVVDGEVISPRAIFVRHDVFSAEVSPRIEVRKRAHAWYAAVMGWLECHAEVRCPNRRSLSRNFWKPAVLREAARCGLAVPETLISNDVPRVQAFAGGRPAIAKPIDGGDYCRRLEDALLFTETRCNGAAASPAIIQPELVAPEIRVYGIAGRFIAFRIGSELVDYRVDPAMTIERVNDVPPELARGLGALMDSLGLDFCAADFKTHPGSRELLFLEINDAPMFERFDEVSGGAIVDAVAHLLGHHAS